MSIDAKPVQVFLSLGSNLGDRAAYLRAAVQQIAALPQTRLCAVSSMQETPPWGKTDQPPFLNMALALETTLPPETLLHAVQRIEAALGRERAEHWGPRTIDIDILMYDDVECHTAELSLPHPYLTKRRFVLGPLAEIAPECRLLGKTIRQWLAELPDA